VKKRERRKARDALSRARGLGCLAKWGGGSLIPKAENEDLLANGQSTRKRGTPGAGALTHSSDRGDGSNYRQTQEKDGLVNEHGTGEGKGGRKTKKAGIWCLDAGD